MSEQILPGDGWRLLGPDEPVKFADEYLSNATGCWHPMTKDLYGWKANCFIAVRRRIPAKPEAMEIDDGFKIECGYGPEHFAILQAGPIGSAGDVVVGNPAEARKLADWLTRFADWREAQEQLQKKSSDN
jgi:hypothetical protein